MFTALSHTRNFSSHPPGFSFPSGAIPRDVLVYRAHKAKIPRSPDPSTACLDIKRPVRTHPRVSLSSSTPPPKIRHQKKTPQETPTSVSLHLASPPPQPKQPLHPSRICTYILQPQTLVTFPARSVHHVSSTLSISYLTVCA